MDIKDITSGPIDSVAALIDLHESLMSAKAGEPIPQLAFRGQPKIFGTLVPSFQRQFARQSYGTADIIERRLLEAFREHYAKLTDISQDMPQPSSIADHQDLRWLSVMQHYEIPTRLLDWSSCFWTSIYFACASDPTDDAELWYYDRSIFLKHRPSSPDANALMINANDSTAEIGFLQRRGRPLLAEFDITLTPRMRVQQAHHTVSTDVFADHGGLLLDVLNEITVPLPTNGGFRRKIIDKACKGRALQFLADHKRITASTVFPDVVGLGRFLRWQFESLRTMLL